MGVGVTKKTKPSVGTTPVGSPGGLVAFPYESLR
jgi:hypothetical protein